MHARIICIGNRLYAPDAAGPMVYDLLARMPLPESIELVDGGLGGLRLLPLLEGCDLVVFVDAASGFGNGRGIVIVDPQVDAVDSAGYGHNEGLAYLLRVAPHVADHPLPDMLVVGIEKSGSPDLCRQAAETCLALIEKQSNRDCLLPLAAVRRDLDDQPGP